MRRRCPFYRRPQTDGRASTNVRCRDRGRVSTRSSRRPSRTSPFGGVQALASAHRRIAAELADTARRMAGYRTLPMGRHDMAAMMSSAPRHAFAGFVEHEEALIALLQARLAQDKAMLQAMAPASSG